jgi:hypothetical protein
MSDNKHYFDLESNWRRVVHDPFYEELYTSGFRRAVPIDHNHPGPSKVMVVDGEIASLELWQHLREKCKTANVTVIASTPRSMHDVMDLSWYQQERDAMFASMAIWPSFTSRGLLPGMTQTLNILKRREHELSKFHLDFKADQIKPLFVFDEWDSLAKKDFLWYCKEDVNIGTIGHSFTPRTNHITEAIRTRFGTSSSSREETSTSYRAEQECLKNYLSAFSQNTVVQTNLCHEFLFSGHLEKQEAKQTSIPSWAQIRVSAEPVPVSPKISTSTTNRSSHQLTANYSSRSRAGKVSRYC